jgi:hypothetical protein
MEALQQEDEEPQEQQDIEDATLQVIHVSSKVFPVR